MTNSQLNARKKNFYKNLDSFSMDIPKITKKKSFKAKNELNEVVKPLKEDEQINIIGSDGDIQYESE